jgi:hypothetical protein
VKEVEMKGWSWLLGVGVMMLVPSIQAQDIGGNDMAVLSSKELRELFKEQKNNIAPAGELIFGLNPQERQKLQELYKSDPDAARIFITEQLEENRQKKQDAAKKIQETAKKFRRSRDQAEKEQLRQVLRRLLVEQFEQTSAEIAVRLKMQEQRLAEVQAAYQERLENSDRLIDAQLEKMTRKRPANRKMKNVQE